MRLPRDVSGDDLARRLARLGYEATRQTGSHLRLTTDRNGRHHITIPRHEALRIGTLAAILSELESHHHLDRSTSTTSRLRSASVDVSTTGDFKAGVPRLAQ